MQITDIAGKVTLNNGIQMPYLGLGVYKTKDGEEVENALLCALRAGYRLVDTAAYYNNEEGVGKVIRNCRIPREEIFVTSKVWIDDQGYEKTLTAFEKSRQKLSLDYLDMYMIHWPVADTLTETWRAMEELYKAGKVKAIGICNSLQHQVNEILQNGSIKPAVLQNEFHPRLIQQDMLNYCDQHHIQYQAWAPLMRGRILDHHLLEKLAAKYDKTVAQLLVRWDLQKNICTIPKSVHCERIMSNAQVFDFEISSADVAVIDALDKGERTGAHPDHFLEYFVNK